MEKLKHELIKSIKIQVSDGNFSSLEEIIEENFEMKEALISSRGKLCKNCPYRSD